ncbi:RNA pseudouridine synthase [Telluria mixta]|uniref:Dual-specificity RNA pseudouridine synthase RluF n=1 Tax=Telluria mixta TaxID=34071 RepID=A0ABT2BTS5_9BURK|nr:RNA pseudouridine synthase [Telluria mixta]MCS0628513.1 RNA pseudouridine synthase [Telluria mixta]WEM93381.1 RNA pseudouridine synthase [Telluria mixta]
MNDEGIRLAKRVAEIVPCSRAEAERYIAGGWVTVDGAVAEDPATRVTTAEVVALLPGAEPVEPVPVTILLHKPAGVDAAGALALIEPATLAASPNARFLRRHLARLTIVTPLEPEASGLLVLSQDWRVTRKLVEDAARIEQEYVAEVTGAIADDGLSRLNASMRVQGRATVPLKASWQSEARLRLAGKDVRPGQVAAMCAAVGLSVTSLRRLRIGRVSLGQLPAGRWRYLLETERF